MSRFFGGSAKGPKTETVVIHRLSPEAYRDLEKQLAPICAPNSAELAAYQLGIQAVLQKLRTGFVVGLPD